VDLIEVLRKRVQDKLDERKNAQSNLDAVLSAPATEGRDLNDVEAKAFGEAKAKIAAIDVDLKASEERLAGLVANEEARTAAETMAAKYPTSPVENKGGAKVGKEARTYSSGNDRRGGSFLRDVMRAHTMNDFQAMQRLDRHMQEERVDRADYMAGIEARDIGTGAFAGLTVPQYLTDLVAPKIRNRRPFADVCRSVPLPAEGMTVNISRITTGSAVAAQASEVAAVQETDIDDTLLTVNVRTISGQQDVSRQVIDRTTGGEQVVVEDLIGAYHEELDRQIIVADGTSGTHLGIKNVASNAAVTYTDASPTAAELHPKLADLLQQISSGVNDMTHFIFHTRRWWWLASQLGTSFPLLTVGGAGLQQVGQLGDAGYMAQGRQYLGAGIVLDRNIETTLGAGTEDAIYGVNANECFLWEDPNAPLLIRAEQVGAGNLMVKFVIYGYSAFTAGRYPLATGDITGTGLIAPTF
jgi:HK97 family phage major capsid protein